MGMMCDVDNIINQTLDELGLPEAVRRLTNCSNPQVRVFLEGEEISQKSLKELKEGYYLYKYEGQTFNAPPRRTRKEILEIINEAKKDVYLTVADFSFVSIYKSGGQS